jgi:hypothetical protein
MRPARYTFAGMLWYAGRYLQRIAMAIVVLGVAIFLVSLLTH